MECKGPAAPATPEQDPSGGVSGVYGEQGISDRPGHELPPPEVQLGGLLADSDLSDTLQLSTRLLGSD
jgi:hypothetical protein